MGGTEGQELAGPDLAPGTGAGVALGDLADGGMVVGHAHGEAVLLARRGDEVFAVGANCTHYGGPLAEGMLVGDTVRCPWHHACFDLRTGEALAAPALSPIACWQVERKDGRVFVGAKREAKLERRAAPPSDVIIVGAGAAGHAAADMLRRQGYVGKLTLIGAETVGPVDRPNLSKDYLAGKAPEEWIPLRPVEWYAEQGIELELGQAVTAIDTAARTITLADNRKRPYDALLLATGATPIRLAIPGADLPHVHVLRSLADSRAIIASVPHVVRAVVIGASFIGLEVAAALRMRNIDVHVIAPETLPLERVLGPEIGAWVKSVHEAHGVCFHLGQGVTAIDEKSVTLSSGEILGANLVVMGVGVRPEVSLAQAAGLHVDDGVVVDAELRTSVAGIWAAGDIARWPDVRSGKSIRVEHWVVAERQGQTAARNILGAGVPFDVAPFFWSAHYDQTIAYVGHTDKNLPWDKITVDGDLAAGNARVTYQAGDKILAVATVGRDKESLAAEHDLEGGGPYH